MQKWAWYDPKWVWSKKFHARCTHDCTFSSPILQYLPTPMSHTCTLKCYSLVTCSDWFRLVSKLTTLKLYNIIILMYTLVLFKANLVWLDGLKVRWSEIIIVEYHFWSITQACFNCLTQPQRDEWASYWDEAINILTITMQFVQLSQK